MKINFILLAIAFVFANIQAHAVDLSGLKSQTKYPSIKNIEAQFKAFKKSLESTKLSAEQKSAMAEVEDSFKIKTKPATLKRQSSRGPGWKDDAIDYIENEYDIHETVSYTNEDGDASEYCGFEWDEELSFDSGHFYKWESVKRVKGSKKSIAYFVTLVVPVKTKDNQTGKWKSCDYPRMEMLFDAKLKDGKPVEIKQ